LFNGFELMITTSGAEIIQIGFGEALIAAF
jgi:hypothetical protein